MSFRRLLFTTALSLVILLAGCGARPTPVPTATPTRTPEPIPTVVVPPGRLGITFVDNDCFLLISDDKKILIDPHQQIVSRAIWTAIQQAQPPFDGIDLILVTHNHSDHFDPDLVGAQLLANPTAALATTGQVANALKTNFPDYGKVQDRVKVFAPAEGARVSATLNGIEIEALFLSHDNPVFNLGFIIRFGGRKLLHTGDTQTPSLPIFDFPKDNLDIAFVPYFWLASSDYVTNGRRLSLDAIQARQYVPMHHSARTAYLASLFEQIAANVPNSIRLRDAMETYLVE